MISQVVCCLQEFVLNDDLLRLIPMLKCQVRMTLEAGCMHTPCDKQHITLSSPSFNKDRSEVNR